MPTVTVGCKIPNGLILRLFNMVDVSEPVMGGGTRTFKKALLNTNAKPVEIKGPSVPFGKMPDHRVIGGYALTPNVDADFFNEWLKQNADHDAVLNKLIFCHEKTEAVEKRAKDNRDVLSGLHPLIPDKDARIPRGNKNMTVSTAVDDKAA